MNGNPRPAPAPAPTRGQRLMRWALVLGLFALQGTGLYLLLRLEPEALPIRVVTVEGELEHLAPGRLEETVAAHLSGGILTQDLASLKAAVEALPWVRTATLSRLWPDRIALAVVERVAVARFGEDALVTAEGVVFRPEDGVLPAGLSKLVARDEQAPVVVARLAEWGAPLAALGLRIETLTLDARGSYSLQLDAGFTLALGKAQVSERIERFLRVYPQLGAVATPTLVDMRYSNGLAIRWSPPEDTPGGAVGGGLARSAEVAAPDGRRAGFSKQQKI